MEHTKHRHICWALPPPDRVAWPCERLPFWYVPMWLWCQDTRLIMFVYHTQRSPGSLNWWRVTWDQRLQVHTTSSVNVVGSALARLSMYWDQGQTASQAYPPWTTWQASSDEGQIQPWTWNPTTKPNSCLSNPDTWTILSGQHKRPSSIPTAAIVSCPSWTGHPNLSFTPWEVFPRTVTIGISTAPSPRTTHICVLILSCPLTPIVLHPRLLPSWFCVYVAVTMKKDAFKLLIFNLLLLF